MTVVDIRNIFSVRNVEFIEVNEESIYYSEEKQELGHNNLFFLEYNRKTATERIIANYSLNDPTFIQHVFSFKNTIVLVLENGGSQVWVYSIDKKSGAENKRSLINCKGISAGCAALDESNILIYMQSKKDNGDLSNKIQNVFLYDMISDKKYYINDDKLRIIKPENIKIYTNNGISQVLLLSPFGDEKTKEQYYVNSRWIRNEVCDYIWCCPLNNLINDIKDSKDNINLKTIVKASTEASARFIGVDNDNLYFKARYFSSSDEYIYSCDINTHEINSKVKIFYDTPRTYYHVDKKESKVYKIFDTGDKSHVAGIISSDVNVEYDTMLGEFLACIEDRYVITKKIITNKDGKYEFEYIYIIDTKVNKYHGYECKCKVRKNTLILY